MSRLYLDACTIIYLEEASGPFHVAAIEQHAGTFLTGDGGLARCT